MTKEEKETLYKDYLKSGLSIKEYASEHGINPAVIRGLVSYNKRLKGEENSPFIKIVEEPKPQQTQSIIFKLDNHKFEINMRDLRVFLENLV